MNILGIIGLGFSPAAALLMDGKLIAMAEEERFIRIKGAYGAMPVNAVRYCMKKCSLGLDDIDSIAFGWDANKYRVYMPLFMTYLWARYRALRKGSGIPEIGGVTNLIQYNPSNLRSEIKRCLQEAGLSGEAPEIVFIPHHLSHAASSFFCSGFDESLIMVIDGSGEDICTSIWMGSDKKIVPKKFYRVSNSLGWFYAAFTEYLGFKPNLEEGKIMGLAACGDESKEVSLKMKDVIGTTLYGKYRVSPKYTFFGNHSSGGRQYSDDLVKLFGPPRMPGEEINKVHMDIAFCVQRRLEDCVLNLIKDVVRREGIKRLCIAGGVGLNCKMNGVLLQSGLVDDIFIQPMSNDAGTALGAAMCQSMRTGVDPRFRMKHTYYGPGYTDREIRDVLDQYRIPYKRIEDISKEVAGRLSMGEIVGWFQGRMEAGPRALGNRSILADPTVPEIKDRLNKRVKKRETFRPYAPSILKDLEGRYIESPASSPFMILALNARKEARERIPSVVHVDRSLRPHIVDKEVNPGYFRLIKHFEEDKGVGALLNTSFNIHGEPIVCTPQDAVRTFYSSGLDCLAMGHYLIVK